MIVQRIIHFRREILLEVPRPAPVFARQGWLLQHIIRDPRAPNGSTELLVDAAMRAAVEEGQRYVTLGLAPLSGEVGPWLRVARLWGAALFDFEGLRAFKAKLRPQACVSLPLRRRLLRSSKTAS